MARANRLERSGFVDACFGEVINRILSHHKSGWDFLKNCRGDRVSYPPKTILVERHGSHNVLPVENGYKNRLLGFNPLKHLPPDHAHDSAEKFKLK